MRQLLLLIFLFAISIDHVIDGARCRKSSVGWWTCRPCGKGSRCHYCSWCTGYCYNGQAGRYPNGKYPVGVQYGSVEFEYKIPFLEMFDDINALLKEDGISDLDIVELYKMTSVATREDCTICNNSPELNNLSIFTDRVYKELAKLTGSHTFKQTAIKKTTETRNIVQNLPKSLKIKVEPNSSILTNLQKGR